RVLERAGLHVHAVAVAQPAGGVGEVADHHVEVIGGGEDAGGAGGGDLLGQGTQIVPGGDVLDGDGDARRLRRGVGDVLRDLEPAGGVQRPAVRLPVEHVHAVDQRGLGESGLPALE